MNFEWDEAKSRANVRKHGFDLADAEEMSRGVMVVDPDTRAKSTGKSAGLASA